MLQCSQALASLVKESIVVRNPSNRPVAFKIKTTAPKQYCVRPNSGRIEPGQTVEVQVLLQALKEEPKPDAKCRDKFLVQSTTITPEHESSSISVLWQAVESRNRTDIHEKKIRCVYLNADNSQNTYIEPSTQDHGGANESYSQVRLIWTTSMQHLTNRDQAAPEFHAAETSAVESSTPQYSSNIANEKNVVDSSNVFKIEAALPSSANQVEAGLSAQLEKANLKIEQLQQQLDAAKSSTKRTDVNTGHNEGVPVPMTALIALIAFIAAYLLF